MRVKITVNGGGNPPGKVADAELIFDQEGDGVLQGLKLIGFSVWEVRSDKSRLNVTFPARQYSVNGERRSFALLRPHGDTAHSIEANLPIRNLIIDAYRQTIGVGMEEHTVSAEACSKSAGGF